MSVSFGPKLNKLINALQGDNYVDAFRPLLRAFDQLTMNQVINNTTTAPPGSPANGDAYLVATGATGAWAGQDQKIAVYSTQITLSGSDTLAPGWEFYTPNEGWEVWVNSLGQKMRYTAAAWTTNQPGFADEEIPTGTANGTNTVFTLAHTPVPSNKVKVYLGGLRMLTQGTNKDCTVSGNTITFVTAPPNNSIIFCDYRY